MRLEGLIRKRILGNPELTGLLAEYCGAPAVFHGDAPDDNQEGWLDGRTLPRISFSYDTLADSERKNAGSLYISIHCENSGAAGAVFPEDVVPLVIRLLKDVIFSPDDFGIFCCSWNRTDSYSVKETKSTSAAYSNNLVVGCDLTFDIIEYPAQVSTDPDPVMAMNRHIAETVPEALVLHYHKIDEFEETKAERPVIYVRNAGYVIDRQTNSVCWMRGTLHIHLLCPDSGIRMKMITALANRISVEGEVIMLDGSPMLVSALEGNNGADYMTVGQLKLETMYGILRTRPLRTGLSGIEILGKRR